MRKNFATKVKDRIRNSKVSGRSKRVEHSRESASGSPVEKDGASRESDLLLIKVSLDKTNETAKEKNVQSTREPRKRPG